MFSFFKRKNKEQDPYAGMEVPADASWAFLGADMHSHFIPGIDDGAKTIEDSLALLQSMADMGYKTVVTTPHIMIDHYPNTSEKILDGLKVVQDAVKQHNINIEVRAAAEYYIDDYFTQLLQKKEPLLPVYKNEVLVEFSMMYEPPMLAQVLFDMLKLGYKPIIAHPERYLFFHKNIEKYVELKDRGCKLQMNMLAITGYYGPHIKGIAEQLMARGLYDYCGSDMHHEKHAILLKMMLSNRDYLKMANYPFQNAKLVGQPG